MFSQNQTHLIGKSSSRRVFLENEYVICIHNLHSYFYMFSPSEWKYPPVAMSGFQRTKKILIILKKPCRMEHNQRKSPNWFSQIDFNEQFVSSIVLNIHHCLERICICISTDCKPSLLLAWPDVQLKPDVFARQQPGPKLEKLFGF